jgi:amino acid adenylation domain-containing protein
VDEAQRTRVRHEWNDTAVAFPDVAGLCVHEAFERWAVLRPGLAAARFAGGELTYLTLNRRANQLARHLRRLGAERERIVGILLDRGLELPVSLLGVHKAGAAYLPLDPQHPASRLSYLVGDAGCEIVVTTRALADLLPDDVVPVCLDDPTVASALAGLPDTNLGHPVHPDNLAYLLYTSGSTGAPKGTLIQHGSVVNLAEYCRRQYRLRPPDRILQFANPAFDVSVFDFFAALCNGVTLVQAPRMTLLDPRAFAELLRTERVTVMDIPPAVAQLLDPDDLPDLRMANIGGEALPAELAERFQAPHRQVHNTYGPTEVTVTSTDYRVPPGPGQGRPPIGRAIANLQAYVVTPDGDLAAVGEPGELLMGGVGVGRGYHRRPALTAEKFVPNPFGAPGSRLYRTGDLVRWRPDGYLEFLDRIDTQLKVNGHRVEPGEIEAALRAHPALAAALVDLVGERDDRTLTAFVVPAAGRETPAIEEVRGFLRGRLPSYLIPGRLIAVDAIPLTPNGKADRARLRDLAAV